MDWREYIEERPDVMCGKPIIKNTRLTVEFILERLGQGSTAEELVETYRGILRPEHIRAAQAFAAACLASEITAWTGELAAQ